MAMQDINSVNVTKIVDDGPVRRFQILVFVLCGLAGFLDGMDTQSISTVAPTIAAHLNLPVAALRPTFVLALVGAALGALTFGALADLYGRTRMLTLAVFIYGIFTIVTIDAQTLHQLFLIRFAAGIGLGGAIPCYLALASEFAPARRRATVASIIWVAYPLGGLVGGAGTRFAVGEVHHGIFGGQGIYLSSCVLPILLAFAFMIWLPESLEFLVAKGASASRIGAIVRRLQPGLPASSSFVSNQCQAQGPLLKQLFTKGRATRTLLLWISLFSTLGVMILSALWTPNLLRDNGISPAMAGGAVTFNAFGALIGMASCGWLIDRFGVARVLVPAFLLGAVATALVGCAAVSVPAMRTELFLLGIFVGMGVSGTIALATVIYPTAIRSSGIGGTIAMGRVGQVMLPLLAGAAVKGGGSDIQLFFALAALLVLCAFAIFVLRSAVQNRSDETIAPVSSLAS
jgi:AAHS family 4-hydroxybenzoate transporter-like MFS transporter